ncbi:MAG: hypothetical protein E7122_02005 [Bacteroidales bacterium]|nr:hypothetical protein [Bacteroidales bacterium]
MGDRVCALPLLTIRRDVKKRGTLRLYCIRLSEKLLIVGAGGKKCTTTYEQDPVLLEIVETLKSIDKKLVTLEKSGIDIHSEIYNLTVRIN